MKTHCIVLAVSALMASVACGESSTPSAAVRVSVDASRVRCEISPWLYGTGMEDVNHEIYGGLDAQRLYGESFEEPCPTGSGDSWQSHGVSAGWDKAEALDGGDFIRDEKIFRQGHASQSLVPNGGVAAIANSGLRRWGVPCRAGKKMVGCLWTRGKVAKLEVALQDYWGERTYAALEIPTEASTNWCRAAFALTPSATDAHGRFLIRASGAGQVWLDDASLADEPTNEFGRLGCREDLAAAFRDEGVTFLRWGGTMVNTSEYKLKNTDGSGARRPYAGFWYRESSGGFGPYEFVRMAHAMRLPCSVAINAYDTVEDAVRFATELGKYDTPIFVQIGNEELVNWAQNPEDSRTMKGVTNYCAAVRRLVPAMRAANPKLKFIQSSHMMRDAANDELMEAVFRALDGLVEYWDVHVLTYDPAQVRKDVDNATRARELLKKWNPQTTMKVVILEENGNNHGMDRALAHAVMLEKARAMGPDMLTSCPANALQPYLHNDNWWDQGAIFFTPTSVWLSPCGQAQKLAASHHRELLVEGTAASDEVSVSATKDRDGKSIVLHLVNSATAPRPVELVLSGADGMQVAKVLSLFGPSPRADNPPSDPLRVAPRDITDGFRAAPTLPPYSYTVVVLERGAMAGTGTGGADARRMRVGLLTDTHISDNPASCALVHRAMALFAREKVDAICHLGDLADVYSPKGFVRYRQEIEEAFGDRVPLTLYAFGGHDRNGYRLQPGEKNLEETVWEIMKKAFKVSHGLYDTVEFRGYAFVIIQEYMDYGRAKKLVDAAVAAHPGKPVFVLMHEPGWNTTDESVAWGNSGIARICGAHPEVIHLSGHTHGSLRNERNIWQGTHTEVSLGCLQGWFGMAGNLPVQPNCRRDDGVMTMDVSDTAVVFHRFSLTTGEEYRPERPWTVPLPFDPKTAPYAPETRRAASRPPEWAPNAKLTVASGTAGGAVRVTFPEARHADGTYRYTAELRDAAGRRLTLAQAFGEFWKASDGDRTGAVSIDFDAALFRSAGDYAISVRPEDFYGNVGAPLEATCRRDAPETGWRTVWSSAEPLRDCEVFSHSWGFNRRPLAVGSDGWLALNAPMFAVVLPPAAAVPPTARRTDCRLVFTLEDEHAANGNWELRVEDAKTGRNVGRFSLESVPGRAGRATYVLPFFSRTADPLAVRLGFSYGAPSARLRLTDVRVEMRTTRAQ